MTTDNYKNAFQRYAEVKQEITNCDEIDMHDTEMFIKDLNGNIHNLSGNIDKKLESVRKSMDYWKDKQDDLRGQNFYNNMKYLYQQILLFLEGKRAIA